MYINQPVKISTDFFIKEKLVKMRTECSISQFVVLWSQNFSYKLFYEFY